MKMERRSDVTVVGVKVAALRAVLSLCVLVSFAFQSLELCPSSRDGSLSGEPFLS